MNLPASQVLSDRIADGLQKHPRGVHLPQSLYGGHIMLDDVASCSTWSKFPRDSSILLAARIRMLAHSKVFIPYHSIGCDEIEIPPNVS